MVVCEKERKDAEGSVEKHTLQREKESKRESEKNVIVDRVFAADNHTVWRALTENDLMKQWYFDLAEFRPEVGFKFEFLAGDEAGKQWKHVCEVTEVVLEKKLVHTWTYRFQGRHRGRPARQT